ncbi:MULTISPECIES: hypothetical protein [Rhodococcus]|uniref:Uncharacterized protein n=1 Tax=Rhodococcus oxybenzonivorans TaxID=1990687 RepID=A0AAE4V628_9NOCA|nr:MULTISPECIES: hypothetical protein [Rhodococcus]MDV7245373.1 hypothetical protein [Rhodococcus oxybenzonivorans]MDV7268473.1 hypothetical protein [Rhodococcus oxybenzonivorans]MDV7272347.1 hypothetical protein [Rhodococcus oxybenzonivorans]MDV7336398.1 hypothetical protein [Rhodococcus oxybenzonivorans]MDV7347698.1 hypothetical protein [Rhodococcus oxybenzonivorans]
MTGPRHGASRHQSHAAADVDRGRLRVAAVLSGLLIGAVIAMALMFGPSAHAETPAERCARETAAAQALWEGTHPGGEPFPGYPCFDPGPETTAPPVPTANLTPGRSTRAVAVSPGARSPDHW